MTNEIKIIVTIKHEGKDALGNLIEGYTIEGAVESAMYSLGSELADSLDIDIDETEDFIEGKFIENFEDEDEHEYTVYMI